MEQRGTIRIAKLVAKVVLAVAVLWFVGRSLKASLAQVDWSSVQIHWPPIALSVLAYAGFVLCRARAYILGVRAAGCPTTWRGPLLAATVAPLLRYVPGKVVAMAGAAMYLADESVGMARASIAVVLAMMANVASVAVLFAAWVLWRHGGSPVMLTWALAALVVCAAGLHPRLLRAGVGWIGRLTGRSVEGFQPHPALTGRMIVWMLLAWVGLGLAYGLVGLSVGQVAAGQFPTMIWAVAVATMAGFFAVFAPAGLGIREGALLVLLTGVLGAPQAALLAVLGRCWQTGIEVIAAAVAWRLTRRRAVRSTPASVQPLVEGK